MIRSLPARIGSGMITCMEIRRIRSLEPDLFATPSADGCSAPLAKPKQPTVNSEAPSARFVLPNNLPEMIKRLEDRELDRLLAAVLGEQKRRGTKSSMDENSRKQRADAVATPLTISKINAVRAAFKAGITGSLRTCVRSGAASTGG